MEKDNNCQEITQCRVCGSGELTQILSLGSLFVSNFVENQAEEGDKEIYPLVLVLCDATKGGCGLLQLKHTVSPRVMYRNYWYRSGVNKTMTQELEGIAHKAEEIAGLGAGDFVVDIGCNDGTLVRSYKNPDIIRVGFEPAHNLVPYAEKHATKVFNDFFSEVPFQKEFGDAKAKVITAIAMFYDLDDPNAFVRDIAKILHQEGIFIIQMSYLPSMLEQNAFDNACHEHLQYYSLASLEALLARHNLETFDVELNDVNGGSFRIYIRRKGGSMGKSQEGRKDRIAALRNREKVLGIEKKETYDAFLARIEALRKKTYDFITSEIKQGKKVYAYGASTKGNTLLQYYGLDSSLITAAAERNPMKWGKKTIGTNIPIISEEQARKDKPDYFLVLPWHFLPEFLEREKEFRAAGGKFIVPLPEFKVI
ncbi:MAG: methyltransferase [Parcubacteria group bacterium Gr01-1014_33]|nr:MAG: methyltransferase [Parcubacteria group bacterium Gr01-1014_33]